MFTGAGGAIFTASCEDQDPLNFIQNSRLGIQPTGNRISKLQFDSNTADLYGNDLASARSNLVLLGTEQSAIDICAGGKVMYRNSSSGNITISSNQSSYMNMADCVVIISPYKALSVSVEFLDISIECSLSAQNKSSGWTASWANNTYQGPCDSCDYDFLQLEECLDQMCTHTTVLKKICGNKAVLWTGENHYQTTDALISRTGIMKLAFRSNNNTVARGFSAKFSSQPVFAASNQLVPGQDSMKYTLVVSDRFQNIVKPDPSSHFLKILICPSNHSDCQDFESISPPSFAIFDDDFIYSVSSPMILRCPLDEKDVVAQLSISGSNLPNIYQAVSCSPCQSGQERTMDTAGKTWVCKSCEKYQYVVDPNRFKCEDCPVGARCDGSLLQGLLEDSIWVPKNTTGQYFLKSCPPVLSSCLRVCSESEFTHC